MSLCLMTNLNGKLYVAADHRKAVYYNGKHYAYNNSTNKLFIGQPSFVVFGAGECRFYEKVFSDLQQLLTTQGGFNAKDIQSVARNTLLDAGQKDYSTNPPLRLVLVVGCICEGQPCYCTLHEMDNFEYHIQELRHNMCDFIGDIGIENGIENERGYEWIDRYFRNTPLTESNIQNFYIDFYTRFQHAGVGGDLSLYCLDGNSIKHIAEIPISVNKTIEWIEFNNPIQPRIYKKWNPQPEHVLSGNVYAKNMDWRGVNGNNSNHTGTVPSWGYANNSIPKSAYGNLSIPTNAIGNGVVVPSKLDRAYATELYVDNLVAQKADIGQLNALVGRFNALMAGEASASSLAASKLYAETLYIQEGGHSSPPTRMTFVNVKDVNGKQRRVLAAADG